ncbi:PREDICTED: uncharacterized protein LOC105364088 [Ceratosolen solmsi marchali]|uniref:Uncharacterized protein LOC105364088 n=1 Tax=Ceratosolen solmsi marchali TaxID=326594 RepID=A0AAJ7DXP3_9HYME|nr:PREDICTED: uncharacterized protein LOC105364088 [Ceratosolen solmsi marchali]
MEKFYRNKETESISKNKSKYVQHWLEHSLYSNTDIPNGVQNIKECSTAINKIDGTSFTIPSLPQSEQQYLPSCSNPMSPILGGKRLRSSKIANLKKIPKKRKITNLQVTQNGDESNHKNLIKQKIEKPKIQLKSEQYYKQNLAVESNSDKFSHKTSIVSEYDKKIGIPNIIESIKRKIFLNTSHLVEEVISQFTESISSENGTTDSTETNIQEINTDSDKTESDLIEDISSQILSKSIFEQKQISNPVSLSSESIDNIQDCESFIIESTESQHCTKSLASSDQINSISTLESKAEYSKPIYIIQNTFEGKKKRKIRKKGTLSDTLCQKMGKERSSINLLRHQLSKKSSNNIVKPFVLLQIIEHLPMINENQLLKCVLVEDTNNLLSSLLKEQTHRFITVMNVPEISNLINTNQKPVLKIFEPWTILDPNQLFIHITQFIAIPNAQENVKITHSMYSKNSKIMQELHCPCIKEKMLSDKCKSKFQDNPFDIIKELFTYK